MSWHSIVLLIFSAMLWLAFASFIAFVLILRISPEASRMLGFLDSVKLKSLRRRIWWILIPLGLILIAGVILILMRQASVFFFLGILLASLALAGAAGFFLIGEVARSTEKSGGS